MYYRQNRVYGTLYDNHYFASTTDGAVTIARRSNASASNVDSVHSWRTGSNHTGDLKSEPDMGVRMPKTKGSLSEILADRKRYIEELDRSMNPATNLGGAETAPRMSRSDTGHEFASAKTLAYPIRMAFTTKPSAGVISQGIGSTYPANMGILGIQNDFSIPYESGITVNASALQKMSSDVFASSSPVGQNASLLVTAAELVRGDLPSVVKNVRKLMLKQQSILKTAGSDYLNIQFGWRPLIADVAGTISTLMTIDRALYYESFRRKRSWDGPSTNSIIDSVEIVDTNGTFAPTRSGTFTGPSGGFGINTRLQSIASDDFRFSSRYAGLARPSRSANMFNERALDVMQRIGLVNDPQALWDLAPWSWLADWAVNIGSGISNASTYSGNGGYRVDYAYVTQRTVRAKYSTLKSVQGASSYSRLNPLRTTGGVITVAKRRIRANPFGFGVDLTGLNSSQFSVLVALGFAKSR